MTWGTDLLDALVAGTAAPPPVVRTLHLGTLDAWGPGWVRKRWTSKPEVMNGDGSMFGGYIAAMADQMLALATLTSVPEGMAFRTVGLSVQFFKLLRGEEIDVEAKVISQSRQLITAEAEFRTLAGDLAAKASAQQVLTPLAPPPSEGG